jgi:hypothetical protein
MLTAPHLSRLALGNELAAMPSSGTTLALLSPTDAKTADAARARAEARCAGAMTLARP